MWEAGCSEPILRNHGKPWFAGNALNEEAVQAEELVRAGNPVCIEEGKKYGSKIYGKDKSGAR